MKYIHFREICSRKMNSICFRYAANPQSSFFASVNPSRSSSIYCRSAPIRYEINPSFAKQTYRVRQHISSLYISPLARYANHIENPARDLSRCVFSVKDNTLINIPLCCTKSSRLSSVSFRGNFYNLWKDYQQ